MSCFFPSMQIINDQFLAPIVFKKTQFEDYRNTKTFHFPSLIVPFRENKIKENKNNKISLHTKTSYKIPVQRKIHALLHNILLKKSSRIKVLRCNYKFLSHSLTKKLEMLLTRINYFCFCSKINLESCLPEISNILQQKLQFIFR